MTMLAPNDLDRIAVALSTPTYTAGARQLIDGTVWVHWRPKTGSKDTVGHFHVQGAVAEAVMTPVAGGWEWTRLYVDPGVRRDRIFRACIAFEASRDTECLIDAGVGGADIYQQAGFDDTGDGKLRMNRQRATEWLKAH